MDDLKITIDSLSAEDKKEFSSFIQRQKKKTNRKDYELFLLLQQKKKYKPQELIARLYPEEPNAVAYYALRKRLMQHLTDYVVLKRMTEDPTASSSIMGLLSLARYLFEVRADRVAWNTLRKAEKLGRDNEQFDLLNAIYNLQIEKADNEFADNLDSIIAKRNANKVNADQDERANIANSLIAQQLNVARTQGRNLKFDEIIQNVLQTYGLTEAVSQRPALFYKLMSIARSAVLARKDFFTFEPFIISEYQKITAEPGFSAAQQIYRINLLYMIAHVLYRNRKFKTSNQYLHELYEALQNEGKSYYSTFYPKYIFLKTANAIFLQNLPESIVLMEDLIEHKAHLLNQRDTLTAQLGLSFLYFAQKAYSKANRILLRQNHSDKWCEKVMGKEWVLKKNLGELIIQYELGNLDIALDIRKAITRNFSSLLSMPVYKNVANFLWLVEQIIVQPHTVIGKNFNKQVEENLDFLPAEQEDLHAMSYYAWLKSKMVNRDYYEVLLELANSR
ncbi:hypothetical protein AHMF7605_07115 [Adhaeribacter arboris]|uniref:Uncharacterized protein n=1 Tax=Adhaeribacter arboris TaxID=2072846 RepID=A0A2T2YCS5_9BACT|nr:hypothetical protein [Adhaeribacter arboris]PSR53315.1 hypothetical protein AHMF7605_07115 [Adhaeribacter arboris]